MNIFEVFAAHIWCHELRFLHETITVKENVYICSWGCETTISDSSTDHRKEKYHKLCTIILVKSIKTSSYCSCNQQLSHYCVKCLNNHFNDVQLSCISALSSTNLMKLSAEIVENFYSASHRQVLELTANYFISFGVHDFMSISLSAQMKCLLLLPAFLRLSLLRCNNSSTSLLRLVSLYRFILH